MIFTLFLCFNFALLVISAPLKNLNKCKKLCPYLKDDKINVHLIPHSHDDLGWLKTFDQYYEGTGHFNAVEDAGVQYIISSVVQALKENPNRRFIQVETGFFWKWWQKQSNKTREDVIDLVKNGQLEMINGGWSMNDEATSHYQSIIDQFTWGFRKLEDTVGKCGRPSVGWQIDPFGHSREHASLVKQLGFDGLVIVRIDYKDKDRRQADKSLDFSWNTNPNFENAQIFTTMFPDFYFEENGFCFDVMCWDRVTTSNVKHYVNNYANILDRYKEYYKTNNIMMPMGRDFTYQKAAQNYASLDIFINGFKNHHTYNVIYSTPSCYIKAVKAEIKKKSIQLEEKTDDFFPYASEPHSYWTGYFTSRPALKRFERIGNNVLQSAKQLTTFSKLNNKFFEKTINPLRQAMGVMQHHDSITGTEKQHVSDDYAKMLHEAILKAEEPVGIIIGDLLKKNAKDEIDLKLSSCLLANVSICDISQKDSFLVVVHNPLSRVVTQYIHLPVNGEKYEITGPDGEEIYDIFDTIHTFDYITETSKPSQKELIFAARNLPALGIKVYYVVKAPNVKSAYKSFQQFSEEKDSVFGTEQNGFTIDAKTGKLSSVTINGIKIEISQEFLYYASCTDGVTGDHRSSGAYIFRPVESEATPMFQESSVSVKFAKGDLVDECIQIINEEVTQIIKVYKGEEDAYIEFDWFIGDLKFVDGKGKEVISRYTVKNFSNNNTFYTDANGRQMIKRELNKRNDFMYNSSQEPVSSNYYPVTSKISIKDESQKMEISVLNDRAQGGTSLQDGVIELMIHRRLNHDDEYGVIEALNEIQYNKGLYIRGQHFLTFGHTESTENLKSNVVFERKLAHNILLAPRVFLADGTCDEISSLEKIQNIINLKFEVLKRDIPENIHILTLEPWKNSYLLRLEHIFNKNVDDVLSSEATVTLKDFFNLFEITEIVETKLGANQLLEDKNLTSVQDENPNNFAIKLKPFEIKTFIIKTDKNNKDGDDNSDDDDKNNNSSKQLHLSSLTVLYLLFNIVFFNM